MDSFLEITLLFHHIPELRTHHIPGRVLEVFQEVVKDIWLRLVPHRLQLVEQAGLLVVIRTYQKVCAQVEIHVFQSPFQF